MTVRQARDARAGATCKLQGIEMLKTALIATGLAIALSTPAAAQSLLSDWGVSDVTQAITAAGATVTGSGAEPSGAIYVTGKATSGMKFLAYGTVCSTSTKRCKGLNLSAGFTQSSDAEVNRRMLEIDRMAVGVRNGGENSLDVNRYIIFDNGITKANLQTNIEVFLSIADDIWNGGGK